MARKLRYNEEEGGMAKAQLQKIESYAAKLNEMIHPEDELEGWVQNKLSVVAAYMGDIKHYLDYELKENFGDGGGVHSKQRHWEVEFTWDSAREDESREVNIMANDVTDAENKVKEKFGPYYKGLRIIEVEEDKEISWDEYAEKRKSGEIMADGGVTIYKEEDLNRRDGKVKKTQVITVENYREALERIEELERKNKNPNIKYYIGNIYREKGGYMAKGGIVMYIQKENTSPKQFYKEVKNLKEFKMELENLKKTGYYSVGGVKKSDYEKRGNRFFADGGEMAKGGYMADGGVAKDLEDIKDQTKKVYVEISKPSDLTLNRVSRQIEEFANLGYKSADILLKMAFVTTDAKGLTNQFQTLKNKVYLLRDVKKYAHGGETKMEDLFMRYEGSTFYEDFQEAKEYLGEDLWKMMSYDEKVEATKYLKATGKVGWFGEMEDIETLSASQYKKGGSVTDKSVTDFIKALEDSNIIAKGAHKNPKAIETIKNIVSMSKKEYNDYIKENPSQNVRMIYTEYSDWVQTYKG